MNLLHNRHLLHNRVRQLVGDGSVALTVKGDCMMPWIESNSQVHVTPLNMYWPGDIVVLLTQHGQYLSHRVIGLYRKQGQVKILTQADSSHQTDTAVPIGSVLGKISGGDCHPYAVSVPLSHRLRALFCFGKVIFRKVIIR